jgi:hypothetical protein
MGGQVMNLLVIIAVGVIVAELVANVAGTNAILNNTTSFWSTSVKGMLGKTS